MEDVLLCPDGTPRSCSLAGDITSTVGFVLEALEGDQATVLMKVMTEVNVERAPSLPASIGPNSNGPVMSGR